MVRLQRGTLEMGSKSAKTREMIQNMKYSAANYNARSLSSNQLDLVDSLFLMARNKIQEDRLWISQDMKMTDYDVFINPRIIGVGRHQKHDWEYCVSFPYFKANVNRYEKIKVQYIDEKFNHCKL